MPTKKTAPEKTVVKKTAPKKTAPKKTKAVKNAAKGFLNWALPMADGGLYRSSKGFPIFQNPEYPNPEEDTLVELAKAQGGIVEMTMKVRVVLIDRPTAVKPDLTAFLVD